MLNQTQIPIESKADFFFQKRKNCDQLLAMFSLFANENRFKILCTLSEGDYCVNDLVKATGGKPSNISQQLKILNLAGYIERNRQGKLIYYHLKEGKIKNLLEYLYDNFGEPSPDITPESAGYKQ